MPIDANLLKEALATAYVHSYGRPFDGDKVLCPNNRGHHGILHAVAVMELIPDLHKIYNEHVNGYSAAISNIAASFKTSMEDLLCLVKIAALFHDTGRKGDGEDRWRKESAKNLYNFLITREIPENLAELLKLTIDAKDDRERFIVGSESIPGTSLLAGKDTDYLRQLVNMADTLEEIRMGKVFECHRLDIYDTPSENILKDAVLDVTIQDKIISVAERIKKECRSSQHEITIQTKNGQLLNLDFSFKTTCWSIDSAFSALTTRYEISLPDNTELDEVYEKLLRVTTHYINKNNADDSKKCDFQTLRTALLNSSIAKHQRIEAFKTALGAIDKSKMNIHRTDDWVRYLYNVLSILIVVPALARARSSYVHYKTVQFWKPESERAFSCVDNFARSIASAG